MEDHAGGFFVFTSNVDAHHFDWFRACEIRECHGNTELYQCSTRACSSGVWRAPLEYQFQVSKETLLAPGEGTVSATGGDTPATDADGGDAPRIGRVHGAARSTTLRYMPGTPPPAGAPGFQTNHPTCPKCKSPARPAILMFDDSMWKDLDSQRERLVRWKAAVAAQAGDRAHTSSRLRVIIMEIGAGDNVTTVREESEICLAEFLEAGADVKFVRVNPQHPLGDREEFKPDGASASAVLSIMGRGLEALEKIDAALPASIDDGRGARPSPGVQQSRWLAGLPFVPKRFFKR